MPVLYSYVLRYDNGAAPNPFWDVCTLTICKPGIRRTAMPGDWIIGTGSAQARCNDGQVHDLSGHVVYAMQVTQRLALSEYDRHCQQQLPNKLPDKRHADWRRRVGDCIYDYSRGAVPTMRPGPHDETNRTTDLSGENALLSTHFHYFGEHPIPLPGHLLQLVKERQGYKKITIEHSIRAFETWIAGFPLNALSADPQLRHRHDGPPDDGPLSQCAICHLTEGSDDEEEIVC